MKDAGRDARRRETRQGGVTRPKRSPQLFAIKSYGRGPDRVPILDRLSILSYMLTSNGRSSHGVLVFSDSPHQEKSDLIELHRLIVAT